MTKFRALLEAYMEAKRERDSFKKLYMEMLKENVRLKKMLSQFQDLIKEELKNV